MKCKNIIRKEYMQQKLQKTMFHYSGKMLHYPKDKYLLSYLQQAREEIWFVKKVL